MLGQALAQPGDELLPAKEEGPLLVAESAQALEGAAFVVGGWLLAQRQGVEAEVQHLQAEAVDLGQSLRALGLCFRAQGRRVRRQQPAQRICLLPEWFQQDRRPHRQQSFQPRQTILDLRRRSAPGPGRR